MSMEKKEINKDLYDFLLYSYFGIDSDDLEIKTEDEIIMLCAQKAYLDLCRTLTFSDSDSKNTKVEEKRKDFRDCICKKIREGVKKLLKTGEKSFDEIHEKICNDIIKCCENYNDGISLKKRSENSEIFTYGQAQKWLNMTMKYMWLLGLWNDKFEKIKIVLHFPVDSYIIDAIKKEGAGVKDLPRQSWSKWDETQYNNLRRIWREHLKSKPEPLTPLEWECKAWIKQAKK